MNPNRRNSYKFRPNHIIVKLLMAKKKILKSVREKWYLAYIWGKQYEWQQISHQKPWSPEESITTFQLLKENCQPGILRPVKISFWNEWKMSIFPEGKKAKKICQQTTLKRMSEGISLNKKKIMKAGILEWSKVRKIM